MFRSPFPTPRPKNNPQQQSQQQSQQQIPTGGLIFRTNSNNGMFTDWWYSGKKKRQQQQQNNTSDVSNTPNTITRLNLDVSEIDNNNSTLNPSSTNAQQQQQQGTPVLDSQISELSSDGTSSNNSLFIRRPTVEDIESYVDSAERHPATSNNYNNNNSTIENNNNNTPNYVERKRSFPLTSPSLPLNNHIHDTTNVQRRLTVEEIERLVGNAETHPYNINNNSQQLLLQEQTIRILQLEQQENNTDIHNNNNNNNIRSRSMNNNTREIILPIRMPASNKNTFNHHTTPSSQIWLSVLALVGIIIVLLEKAEREGDMAAKNTAGWAILLLLVVSLIV
jgi:hypothetical protein